MGRGLVPVLGHVPTLTQGNLSTTSHGATGVDSTPWETSGCEKAVPRVQPNKVFLIQKHSSVGIEETQRAGDAKPEEPTGSSFLKSQRIQARVSY